MHVDRIVQYPKSLTDYILIIIGIINMILSGILLDDYDLDYNTIISVTVILGITLQIILYDIILYIVCNLAKGLVQKIAGKPKELKAIVVNNQAILDNECEIGDLVVCEDEYYKIISGKMYKTDITLIEVKLKKL